MFYSGKKKRHTIKFQVLIDAHKNILPVAYSPEQKHDSTLFKESRLHFSAPHYLLMDSGYKGAQKHYPNVLLPLKKRSIIPCLTKTGVIITGFPSKG